MIIHAGYDYGEADEDRRIPIGFCVFDPKEAPQINFSVANSCMKAKCVQALKDNWDSYQIIPFFEGPDEEWNYACDPCLVICDHCKKVLYEAGHVPEVFEIIYGTAEDQKAA